jgi:hypothetical protein
VAYSLRPKRTSQEYFWAVLPSARISLKRGGDLRLLDLNESLVVSPRAGADLVALDDALKALEAIDPRKSQVIELRFFGGLSVQETAEALHVSERPCIGIGSLPKAGSGASWAKGRPAEPERKPASACHLPKERLQALDTN